MAGKFHNKIRTPDHPPHPTPPCLGLNPKNIGSLNETWFNSKHNKSRPATAWQQACERMTSQVMVFDLTPRTGYSRMKYLSSLSDSPFSLSRSTGQCKSQSYMYLWVEWETIICCWILFLINRKPQVQHKGALFITYIFYYYHYLLLFAQVIFLQRKKVFSTI